MHVSARLAAAGTARDLEGALALIAAELGSSKVCLSAFDPDEGTIQTLVENGETSAETVFVLHEYPLNALRARGRALDGFHRRFIPKALRSPRKTTRRR